MDHKWEKWLLQTADHWQDLNSVVKEVGIAKIDHEHKRMIDYMIEINKLLLKLEDNFTLEDYHEQERLIRSFYNYIQYHCSSEESFITKYNIPGLGTQEREHKKLLKIVEQIIYQFETGRVISAFGHRTELLEEIIKHVNNVDYKIFNIDNISNHIINAHNWKDINEFIRFVHIPIIDQQHRILTEMIIRELTYLKRYRDNKEKELRKDTLYEVLEFAKLHFKTEEGIIKNHIKKEYNKQHKEHNEFIEFIEKSNEGIISGDISAIENVERELLLWWVKHININDYNTFRKNLWIEPILEKAQKKEEVMWLFTKLGIEQVDNDHIHFINILFKNLKVFNDAESSTTEEKNRAIIELYNYAKDHFSREEGIMLERNVMDKDQHFLEHRYILEQLKDFIKLNKSNQVEFSNAFKQKILYKWIMHINDTDTGTFGVNYD